MGLAVSWPYHTADYLLWRFESGWRSVSDVGFTYFRGADLIKMQSATQAYMVSASLIGCGILSLVQMSRIRLWRNYRLGTGLITVVGTSFATLSTAFSVGVRHYGLGQFKDDSRMLNYFDRFSGPYMPTELARLLLLMVSKLMAHVQTPMVSSLERH